MVDYFVWFDSLRPINIFSVIKGRVFLGWTSTKLGLMFLLKDTTQWRRWGSNPRPFGLESSTLPLSHCGRLDTMLCNKRLTIALIRLHIWASCFAPCYLQTREDRFSHALVHQCINLGKYRSFSNFTKKKTFLWIIYLSFPVYGYKFYQTPISRVFYQMIFQTRLHTELLAAIGNERSSKKPKPS